jgi:hypothetical protein
MSLQNDERLHHDLKQFKSNIGQYLTLGPDCSIGIVTREGGDDDGNGGITSFDFHKFKHNIPMTVHPQNLYLEISANESSQSQILIISLTRNSDDHLIISKQFDYFKLKKFLQENYSITIPEAIVFFALVEA